MNTITTVPGMAQNHKVYYNVDNGGTSKHSIMAIETVAITYHYRQESTSLSKIRNNHFTIAPLLCGQQNVGALC